MDAIELDDLVKNCENKTNWKNWKFYDSFFDRFDEYRGLIQKNKPKPEETDKFIEVCNIKIELAKTLMREMGAVFSIILGIIIVVIGIKGDGGIIQIINNNFTIIIVGIIIGFIIFGVLRLHYRLHIHAWTTFKEAAILNKEYKKQN